MELFVYHVMIIRLVCVLLLSNFYICLEHLVCLVLLVCVMLPREQGIAVFHLLAIHKLRSNTFTVSDLLVE